MHLVLRLRGGCFMAGTAITMADGTSVPIERVVVGDRVVALANQVDNGHASRPTPTSAVVAAVAEKTHNDIVVLHTAEGSVRCTPDHPFLVRGKGWAAVEPSSHSGHRRLAAGDELVALESGCSRAVETRMLMRVERLELKEPVKTYVGVLVLRRVGGLGRVVMRLLRHETFLEK